MKIDLENKVVKNGMIMDSKMRNQNGRQEKPPETPHLMQQWRKLNDHLPPPPTAASNPNPPPPISQTGQCIMGIGLGEGGEREMRVAQLDGAI